MHLNYPPKMPYMHTHPPLHFASSLCIFIVVFFYLTVLSLISPLWMEKSIIPIPHRDRSRKRAECEYKKDRYAA